MKKKMMFKMLLSVLICFALLLNGAFASVNVLAGEELESDVVTEVSDDVVSEVPADDSDVTDVAADVVTAVDPDSVVIEESDSVDAVDEEVFESDASAAGEDSEDGSDATDLQEDGEGEPDAVEPEAEVAESYEFLEPWVNPVYADLYAAGAFQLKSMADFNGQLPVARAAAYTTIEAAGAYVREQLRLRAETISVS